MCSSIVYASGTGEAPWQHQLLYPIYEKQLQEIRAWIIMNGEFSIGWFSMQAVFRDKDGTLYIMWKDPWGEFLVIDGAAAGDPVYYLTFTTEGLWDRMVDVVGKVDLVNNQTIPFYNSQAEDIPSIYNSIFLKRLWNFYTKHVNPDWEPEDLMVSIW